MGFHPVAVHIYTQAIHRTTQITNNVEECGPCPVFASFTLSFALQLRKKHGKTSVRVRKTSVRLIKTSVSVQCTSVSVQYISVSVQCYFGCCHCSIRFYHNDVYSNAVYRYHVCHIPVRELFSLPPHKFAYPSFFCYRF